MSSENSIGERNPDVPHDTEDKSWWLLRGEEYEKSFVALCRSQLGLDARINPEKQHNPMAPDLVVEGLLADLKTQKTPFFTADRFGLDPRFAVTFNRKDYERYRRLYPSIMIYFWVDWVQTAWKNRRIKYYGGFFRAPFAAIAKTIEAGAPEHAYRHREGDRLGNATSSFVLDVREFQALFVTEVEPKVRQAP